MKFTAVLGKTPAHNPGVESRGELLLSNNETHYMTYQANMAVKYMLNMNQSNFKIPGHDSQEGDDSFETVHTIRQPSQH